MELALNAFWLLVALASFLLWWRRKPHAARGRRQLCDSLRRLATLACALALLFPVISVTDDLHGEQPLAEDSSTSQRVLKRWAGSQDSSNHDPLASSPPYSGLRQPYLLDKGALGWILLSLAPPSLSGLAHSFEGRAPPLLA